MTTPPMQAPGLDFFVIGAQKCATSWLYSCLAEHPQISLPARKREIHYLGGAVHRRRGDAWFFARYRSVGRPVRGDVSVEYLEDPGSAAYLHARFPRARIVVALRDPIDRAISAYHWSLRNGVVPDESPDQALCRALDPGSEPRVRDCLDRGLYAERLERYVTRFGAAQVFLVLYERLRTEPLVVLHGLYAFLGVDPDFMPTAHASRPKRNAYSASLASFERRLGRVRPLRKLADLLNQKLAQAGLGGSRPELDASLLDRLREFYADDLRRFVALAGALPERQRTGFDRLAAAWPTAAGPASQPLPAP